jgi:beta-xylosidase
MGVDTNGDGIGEPVAVYRKPDVGRTYPFSVPATSDEFDADKLGLQWQWQTNHRPDWYSLQARPGHLRLYARPLPQGAFTLYDARHIVSQKFPAPAFTATAKLEFSPAAAGERAGLTVFGHEYRYIALESREDGMRLLFVAGRGDKESSSEKETAAVVLPASTGTVYVRVEVVPEGRCTFAYSFDGTAYVPIGEPFDAAPGHWGGAKLGLFCLSPAQVQTDAGGYADIDWFRIE